MRQIKISVGIVTIISSIATLIYLYRLSFVLQPPHHVQSSSSKSQIGTPLKHVSLDEVYKDISRSERGEYVLDLADERPSSLMVETPGCKIPLTLVDYKKHVIDLDKNKNFTCGRRAVFLRKVGDNIVKANIKPFILVKYMKDYKTFDCCYQFIIDSVQYPHDRPVLKYSNCTKFKDDALITLQSDFIHIQCTGYADNNRSKVIYSDMYAFAKKMDVKPRNNKCKVQYNVLMIGMDSMSLVRAVKTMPRTTAFLKNDNWLGFRGYHKIADNTFPNIMAALTGKNFSDITKRCYGIMDKCKNLLIWNYFKEIGYVTAYGEDYLQLPDTFTKEFAFKKPPTDHYMRPFFLKGESKRHNNSLLCSGKVCAGQQMLDYALDFANTYKKDSFFGFFWLNSFSHDVKSHPEIADKIVENFLNQLVYTGVMMNTFIIFFSDHGLRFGELRFTMEAYYDDRLPMNFMWVPLFFKGRHPYELRALSINQFRLMTPYDMFSTLVDIKRISECGNDTSPAPDGCQNCHSIFKVINSTRTCSDASIDEKWCSCHKLYPLPIQDTIGMKSVEHAVKHIQSLVKAIPTQQCWGCMTLSLKNVLRIHFYYANDKVSLFYVVAFSMTPGNVAYEATVLRTNDKNVTLVGPISVITNYRGLGKCALSRRDRLFCICQKIQPCL
ncbi:unnamed protein product [Chrysodeixis includens]|uniref:Uncharacterized protein n=1 Tax=Chrysodeixis includens TaxID=689277 RepID=A0A9P0FWK1_CHRIL|nr:unnamed protein product [Chrysodeixis includens]